MAVSPTHRARKTGTVILTERPATRARWSRIANMAVTAAFGGFVLVVGFAQHGWSDWFADAFLTVGLLGMAVEVRALILGRLLGDPVLTLTVAPDQHLHLGGVLVARFERRAGSRRPRHLPRLSAELRCEERRYHLNEGTVDTHTHKLYRGPVPITPQTTPGAVGGQLVARIPLDQPPSSGWAPTRCSVQPDHRQTVWSVTVTVRERATPKDRCVFIVPVSAVRDGTPPRASAAT
jgi:hypothetical protein